MSEWHGKQRRRLDGRDRGRTPARHCVDLPWRGDGWRAMRPTPVAVAQPVERPPETRGAAGSIPAGHIARRTRPTRSARGRTATGAVPRLENGWLSRAWGFDSLSFRLGSVAQQAELPALNRRVAGSTPAGALSRHRRGPTGRRSRPPGRSARRHPHVDRAPDAGVRRASPQDARRDARSEAWPSGKAAPCYGVGASSASAGSSPAASVPFRPVAQWKRAVGFEPTCARSSRAGASRTRSTAGSSIAESASLTKRRLGVRVPRRGYALEAQLGRAAAL